MVNQVQPLSFYQKCVPYDADQKVVLINAPLKSKPFYNIYNIEYFNNMVGGVETEYLKNSYSTFCESNVFKINR